MHPNADNLIATRFDTVIYDLDGTLIDSARDSREAISRVLGDHGFPPISDEDARIFMGEGSKITMRRAFAKNGRTLDDAEASAVTREFVSYYEQDPVRYTTAFDGVAEVVARLDRLGLKQGVCTNKFEKSARMILQGLKKPHECAAFGVNCTPENPLGAPMVSSEGACAAYYHYGRRQNHDRVQPELSGTPSR